MFNVFTNLFRIFYLFLTFLISGILFSLIRFKYIKKRAEVSSPKFKKFSRKFGVKLRKWIIRSGPSFIKLGQILSTRQDIVGEVIANELSKLQDRVPPFSFNLVKKTIESELRKKLDDIFLEIDPEPIAAASIAQVHKAYLLNNDEVAIKVLRPNIAKQFSKDIKLLNFIVRIANIFLADSKRLRLQEVVDTLKSISSRELDLRHEAACADKIAENCKDDKGIVIPKIYWNYTSEKILVSQWVTGICITQTEALVLEGHSLKDIAKKLAINFFNQVYRDGFFHADMHPGNLLVNSNGDIVMLDFGITGVLKEEDRIFLAKVIYAFMNKNYDQVAQLHFEKGIVPKDQNIEYFSLACRSIGEPIVGKPVNEISIGKLLKQLIAISKQFEMITQPQFLLLQKTIMTVEGVGMTIYPQVNMWKLAEPWIMKWARDNFGIKSNIKKGMSELLELVKNFPHLIFLLNHFIKEFEKQNSNKK